MVQIGQESSPVGLQLGNFCIGTIFADRQDAALLHKFRAVTLESEKAVLQNAVTATDQQIDALVYELYGLTDDEIKLVEGNQ